jgi:hypothetical protein
MPKISGRSAVLSHPGQLEHLHAPPCRLAASEEQSGDVPPDAIHFF